MPSEARLFIFDWDGTLMDSERQIVHCMQAAADDLKVVMPAYEAVRGIIGLGLPEAIQQLFPDQDAGSREAIRQAYALHFLGGTGGGSQLFPHARELLADLRGAGHHLAIATGKSRLGLDRVLAVTALDDCFHITRCADETASKPDPRMLREILVALDRPPREALMIGDTTFDLEMAARAGVPSVGLAHGVHAPADLERHGPLAIVPDLHALAEFLARR
ncbi:MAG: HAD-IA family hydrolase [Pseudomonadota bacterium]